MTEVRGEGKSWRRARVCHRTREKRRNSFLSAHLRGSWFGPWSNPAVTESIPGPPLSTMKVARPELSAINDKVIHDVHDRFQLWATRLFELVVPGGGPGFVAHGLSRIDPPDSLPGPAGGRSYNARSSFSPRSGRLLRSLSP
jgi:hypothetical protein